MYRSGAEKITYQMSHEWHEHVQTHRLGTIKDPSEPGQIGTGMAYARMQMHSGQEPGQGQPLRQRPNQSVAC